MHPAPQPSPKPKGKAPVKKQSPSPTKPMTVEKVGDFDYAAYGIPIYPGAKINIDETLAFRADNRHPRQVAVTLDSKDGVPEIATWYKDQIKATSAYAGGDLGSLAGTTDMGYPIRISIAKIDTKSAIILTIDDNRKK